MRFTLYAQIMSKHRNIRRLKVQENRTGLYECSNIYVFGRNKACSLRDVSVTGGISTDAGIVGFS